MTVYPSREATVVEMGISGEKEAKKGNFIMHNVIIIKKAVAGSNDTRI